MSVKYVVKGDPLVDKIKTIIVDDGKLAVNDMLNIVDWNENGFEIVGTAYNGREGLELFKQTKPDLVITDLKMPVMTGLEMTEEIRKLSKTVKIIFLSGYEDFYAARLAISFEVNDYLLKHEINRETMTEKLNEIKREIESDATSDRRLFENSLYEYFSNIDYESVKFDEEVLPLMKKKYCMLLVSLKQPLPIIRLLSNMTIKINEKFDAGRLYRRCKSEDVSIAGIVEQINDNIFIALNLTTGKNIIQTINRFCSTLETELEYFFGKEFTINILAQNADIYDCRKLYYQYEQQIKVNYFFQKSRICYLNMSLYQYDVEVKFDINYLKNCIKSGNNAEVSAYIEKTYSLIYKNYSYCSLSTITGLLLVLLEDYRYKINTSRGANDFVLFDEKEVGMWNSVEGISKWLKEKFSILNDYLKNGSKLEYSESVNMAIDYICKNYSDTSLCLEQIEKHVGISYSRLCIIFKQETGTSINNFIIDYRIKKAKELLAAEIYKISEVAEAVGFASTSYFCKVFKKNTGCSPLAYKGRLRKNEEAFPKAED